MCPQIFPLIKDNLLWLGYGFNGGNAFFKVANDNVDYASGCYDSSTGLVKFRNCCWYTNLDHKKRHEDLILYKSYNPEEYPTYENYDAIEVSKTSEIPLDYNGNMGVPITFMDKYNPTQFEIVGVSNVLGANKPNNLPKDKQGGPAFYLKENGQYKRMFDRIVIRRKK